MVSQGKLPQELKGFINSVTWTYAKTMPEWPHEYIVRNRIDERLFVDLVVHIRANGYLGRFYAKPITYFEEDGLVYWTMGAPVEDTTNIHLQEGEYL